MKKMKWTVITLAASLLIMTFAAAAQATVLRAFVSSTGNDVNIGANCVQASPCKTFAVAIGAVTAGGELIALDTSGYGPLTINKAITIATVPGATAFVVAATGTVAFLIQAGATDLVVLRNINFNGSNAAGTTGVQNNSGKLEVHDCKFSQLTVGIFLFNSKADLYNCILTGNTTAVSVNGAGMDISNAASVSSALLTIAFGSITWNGTAISVANPGSNPTFNVWLLGPSNQSWYTNLGQNGTLISGTGTGCPCTLVGTYTGNSGSPH
jgi:nitrous oxidase accessory protein NosD